MGMKTFDEVGNVGFTKSWQDENKDLILEFKAGDVREVRFLPIFLPMALHWVPFIKKGKNAVRFFPQMCLRWDLKASVMDDELECPACDRDVHANENGIFWVLDVEALYVGDKSRVLKIFEVGSRERKKIANLAKFNKVQGTPQHIGHSKYGRVCQVHYDPNNSDPALRWTFSKAERLPIKMMDSAVKVKIPDSADSDFAGKVFTFELQDLLDIVVPPSLSETKQKFARMKVDEAISRLDKEKKEEADEGDDDDDSGSRRQRKGSSPRRRSRDDDDDEPESKPSRRRKRPSRDDTDDPEDDFGDDGDDEPEEKPARRRGKKPPKEEEEDFGDDDDGDGDDEPEEKPARRRGKKPPKDEDDDFGDDDDEPEEKPARRRGKKPPKDEDDDFGDDDDGDDEPAPRRSSRNRESSGGKRRDRSSRRSRRAKEDDGGDDDDDDGSRCNKKASRGAKCPQHKRCFGHIGDAGTEDCTVCPHRDECMDVTAEDDED